MLEHNNGIYLLAIVSQADLSDTFDPGVVPSEHQSIELLEYSYKNPFDINDNLEWVYLDQFQSLQMYIATLENGTDTCDDFDSCVQKKLLTETLPAMKHAGCLVHVLLRKTKR